MTDVQWFAFVYLPLGVTVFGALVAGGGLGLINLADHNWWAARREAADRRRLKDSEDLRKRYEALERDLAALRQTLEERDRKRQSGEESALFPPPAPS